MTAGLSRKQSLLVATYAVGTAFLVLFFFIVGVRWTRMPHSIGRLSASASSHPGLSLAAFITNIAESDFRYTQARDCLQETHDLVGAQHDRQLARLTRIGDALRHRVLAERYAIEEPQRADDLVQRRPCDPRCNQMNLERMDIFQAKTIRGATKIPTELRYRIKVRLFASPATDCGGSGAPLHPCRGTLRRT
jgi:hypothetical protein